MLAPVDEHLAVTGELEAGLGDVATVRPVATVEQARRASTGSDDEPACPAVVVLSDTVGPVDEVVAALGADPALAAATTLLVTRRREHDDLTSTIDHDRIDALIAVPWTTGALANHVRSQLARWLRGHRPDDPRGEAMIDDEGRALELPSSHLLRDLELDDDAVTVELLAEVEAVLGPRPRLQLPAGTRLTHQDVGVDAVLIVLRGSVALDRTTPVGDLRLHHDSTGPVIGLLSLAQQRRAFFTARTTTDVEVVHLSLEQLDRVLWERPEVGALLAAVAMRALAQRLRRSEQLQVEKIELNRTLDEERHRLRQALHELEQARLDLVEQARFATLGELAAGIAHELNNPIAAVERATSFLAADVTTVLGHHPTGALAAEVAEAARTRRPRSTAEERRRRRELEHQLRDPALARRLVTAGIDDPDLAGRVARAGEDDRVLLDAAAGIGAAVRNLEVATRQVVGLVGSLRSYARPDGDSLVDADLHAGIDDTLRLTAHRLRGTEVERRFGALPLVRCHPAQLDQVWTNLLVNAAEELAGAGTITITTDTPDPEHVRVRLVDDGPGIDPQVLPRVFEPRFTTKQGTVRYGLGLGLAIAKRIVDGHGGTIELTSRPGRTEATVVLPVAGPPDHEETT